MGNFRHSGAARARRWPRTAAALAWVLLASAAAVLARAGAAPVALRWQLDRAGPAEAAQGSMPAAFTLTNTGTEALAGRHWAIYFNCMMDVELGSAFKDLVLERVTGPLYRLRPGDGFAELPPGQSLHIPLLHPDTLVNSSLAPEGPYLVLDRAPDAGLPIIDFQRAPFPGDHAEGPEQIYARNARVTPLAESQLPPVFPTPREYQRRPGTVHWSVLPRVVGAPQLGTELAFANALLQPRFAGRPAGAEAPLLRLSVAALPGIKEPEGYQLTIDPRTGVSITGVSAAGVARGLASFRQLLPAAGPAQRGLDLPVVSIRDAPRFGYRGLMMDVARNFQPKAEVLRVLDLMSRYKLNTLHFHLTDDEGWRIEIAEFPELTAVGGRRGHSEHWDDRLPPAYGSGPSVGDPYGSGYYTRADYIDILKYAAARRIEVIPEIEMPGHARAAVMSMAARARRLGGAGAAANQYLLSDPQDRSVYESPQAYTDNVMNPGLPSTYAFIERVVAAMAALHRAAGVPLRSLHVGGDELPPGAWDRSPACQELMKRERFANGAELWDYFYRRVGALLAAHGVALDGWEEIGSRTVSIDGRPVRAANPVFASSGYTVYVWRNTEGAEDLADRLANSGYPVVLAPASRLYLDLAPYPSPFEPGQNWAGYVDLDTVFDYVPLDDTRVAADDPRRLPDRQPLSAAGQQHIRGLEGTLFSETVHEPERLDYMLMPRLLAIAERAWAPDPAWTRQPDRDHAAPLMAQAWSAFVSQLGLQVLPRLDAEHAVLYRIPPPGLKRASGVVLVNQQIPGFTLRYTADGSEPGASSPLVTGPITARGLIRVAAFDRNGRGGRSSQLDNR